MKNKQRRNPEIEDMSVFEWEKQHRQQQRLISGSKAVHNYATKIEREINAWGKRSDAARIDREVNALANRKDNRVPQFLMANSSDRGVER